MLCWCLAAVARDWGDRDKRRVTAWSNNQAVMPVASGLAASQTDGYKPTDRRSGRRASSIVLGSEADVRAHVSRSSHPYTTQQLNVSMLPGCCCANASWIPHPRTGTAALAIARGTSNGACQCGWCKSSPAVQMQGRTVCDDITDKGCAEVPQLLLDAASSGADVLSHTPWDNSISVVLCVRHSSPS